MDRDSPWCTTVWVEQVGSDSMLRVLASADDGDLAFPSGLGALRIWNFYGDRNPDDAHRWSCVGGWVSRCIVVEQQYSNRQSSIRFGFGADFTNGDVSVEPDAANSSSITRIAASFVREGS
jgi:hypothetical protein